MIIGSQAEEGRAATTIDWTVLLDAFATIGLMNTWGRRMAIITNFSNGL
jgi:hypothetical protein